MRLTKIIVYTCSWNNPISHYSTPSKATCISVDLYFASTNLTPKDWTTRWTAQLNLPLFARNHLSSPGNFNHWRMLNASAINYNYRYSVLIQIFNRSHSAKGRVGLMRQLTNGTYMYSAPTVTSLKCECEIVVCCHILVWLQPPTQ